jgi:predicted transposase YdaD
MEMISTIMVYRFTNLTRTEVEAMIGITLQETRVYRDAKAEGVSEGRQAEAQSMILRQLSRRFGTLSPEVNAVVASQSVDSLAKPLRMRIAASQIRDRDTIYRYIALQ